MNPGLVSHYVKHALRKLYGGDADYGTMARELGLTTVHISERDTQKTHMQVSENRFINTWSVKGLTRKSTIFNHPVMALKISYKWILSSP